MKRPTALWFGLVFAGLSLASRGLAQQDSTSSKPAQTSGKIPAGASRTFYVHQGEVQTTPPPEWGINEDSWYRIGATELAPDGSGTTYNSLWVPESNGYTYQRWVTGGYAHLIGFAHLPPGALVNGLGVDYCEGNASGPFGYVHVYVCGRDGVCPTTPVFSFDLGNFGPGCTGVIQGGPTFTVDNDLNEVLVDVKFAYTDGSETIASVGFAYQLQVSPAPGSATFGDVPTSDGAFQYVEALVAAGITAGCGGGNYCPDSFVTRRQMAVFIAKALGLDWPNH